MDRPQTQLAPRKRTFFKRRLTLRNMQQAKDVFLQGTIPSPVSNNLAFNSDGAPISPMIPPPPPVQRSESFQYENIDSIQLGPLPPALEPALYSDPQGQVNPTSAQVSPTALPAPLNMEEAQLLLESLALNNNNNDQSHDQGDRNGDEIWVERLVNVYVEPAPPDLERQESALSPTSLSSSTWEDEYAEDFESTNTNENIFHGTKTRSETSTSTSRLESIISQDIHQNNDNRQDLPMQRSITSASLSCSSNKKDDDNDFHGWRRSSIEVSANPPVTLAFIPSGLCVGDRVVWVKDDHPEIGTVRWIGKIRNQFYSGIEFDKPVGNSSGIYGYGVGMYKRLFTCQLAYGRFVPVKELVLYKDYHDTGVKSGIVCIICRDDFLDTWEPDICLQTISKDEDLQLFHMVSTKCGHLYHWGCLDHWFSTKKKTDFHCPYCLKTMERDEVIRIFPSQI